MFAFKEMKIRNKKILHLTIGDYVQPNQQEILPNCLKSEALVFNGLITLNIFSNNFDNFRYKENRWRFYAENH